MSQIFANDLIRLTIDIPELALAVGEIGRVVSSWLYPNTAYEVDFTPQRAVRGRRVLLLQDQIDLAREHRLANRFG